MWHSMDVPAFLKPGGVASELVLALAFRRCTKPLTQTGSRPQNEVISTNFQDCTGFVACISIGGTCHWH